MGLVNAIVELYRRVSCNLPDDVVKALEKALEKEKGSSKEAIKTILANVKIAKEESRPICQDTGVPIFFVFYPKEYSQQKIKNAIIEATVIATQKNYLRPNAVDSVSNENSGNNLGSGMPRIKFNEWNKRSIEIKLMLKGGGSENVSAQYSLPNIKLKANRDLEGVRKCVLDTVFKAQGKGCSPGIIGVCIGGDRSSSYDIAKEQLLRNLNDFNEDIELMNLEEQLLKELNELNIGPMGFSGKTTVLGVKIGALHRIPACFFVSIAYMCWACRRGKMLYQDGVVKYD